MFYVYVLKSIERDLLLQRPLPKFKKRIAQHNSGMTKSIRPYMPFELVYFEEFYAEEEAIVREKYFKTAAGRKFLKSKLAS